MTENKNLEKIFHACGFNKIDENLVKDISKIVDWQEILKTINVESVKSMFHTLGENVSYISNNDIVQNENIDVLTNAPEKEDSFFLVPKVIKN